MTKRDALSVSLKILGVVALYRALFGAIMTFGSMAWRLEVSQSLDFPLYLTMSVVQYVLALAAGCVLLMWGDRIAARLVRQDAELPTIAATGWQKPVFVVALKVVGIVCLVNGLPRFARTAALAAFTRTFPRYATPQGAGEALYAIVLIALGVYLLSGARHLVAFAFKERNRPLTDTKGT